jgi:cell division protein FtsL
MLKKNQQFSLYGLNVTFDAMLVFIFMTIFSGGATWFEFVWFTSNLIPIIAVSGALFLYKPSLNKITLLAVVTLSSLLFWYMTSSLLLSILISIILMWRSAENWNDPFKTDLELIFGLGAVLTFILSLFFKDGYTVIYGAIWTQFMLMLLIKMTLHYFKNNSIMIVMKDFAVPLTLVGLSSVILAVLGPIKQLIYWILDGVFFILYYILAVPLWKLISLLPPLIQMLKQLFKMDEKGKQNTGNETDVLEQRPETLAESPMLLYTTIAVLIIIVIFFLWKKRNVFNNQASLLLNGNISVLDSSYANSQLIGKKRWLQSKDRTRKKFLQFEKVMDKKGFGREPGESAVNWFLRLELSGKDADSVLAAYEKVRYGEESISDEEYNQYVSALKKVEKSDHLKKPQ